MKTAFEEIVDVQSIGKGSVKRFKEIVAHGLKEDVKASSEDVETVLFVGIDVQNDFLENGELAVPGSFKDVENMSRFIYRNIEKITTICVSLDFHEMEQIFHPCWWVDKDGRNPDPFTVITIEDIESEKWMAVYKQKESMEYIEQLEKVGKKQLVIWPYHCLKGTYGSALEGQFANMIHFHSVVRKSPIVKIAKGEDPLSEMYGIVKPEYSREDKTNYSFLKSLKKYEKILIAGEAKSHCVLETVKQIVEHYSEDIDLTSRIYLLKDCMCSIPGFEGETELEIEELKKHYGIKVLNSTELTL